MIKNKWFTIFPTAVPPRVRLVCLPHAGGSVSTFFPLKKRMPADIEVCAVQLPGRDSRYHEPFCTDLVEVAEHLMDALSHLPPVPALAIFGHSMGALLAIELAHALTGRHRSPDAVIVSGRSAPRRHAVVERPMHRLPDEEFIAQLQERYGGVPEAILADRELMGIYLPILRADLQAVETYRYTAQPARDWPLMVYCGAEDLAVGGGGLERWREHTTGPFDIRIFPGGHFFYQTHREPFTRHLIDDLNRWTTFRGSEARVSP